MRKLLLVIGSLLFATPVYAAPQLTGLIDFTGSNTYDIVAQTITFIGLQDATSDTGSLASFGTCNACMTFKNINYSSGFSPVGNEITGTNNGLSFALDLESISNFSAQPTFLDVTGGALLHLTGFADTPGTFFFSTQGPQGPEVSFSTTAITVPEPGSLAVMGIGLIALGMVKYWRKVV